MSTPIRDFHSVMHAQEVIFGAGAVSRLEETLRHFHWKRVLLCTSRSLRENGHAQRLEEALGKRLAASYDRVQPHVQDVQVAKVLELARRKQVDAVLGIGGGSSIGMAKAVGFQAQLPIVAIPTTYAGSEMTPVYGVTNTSENPPRKVTVSNPKIAPNLVIYDPDLTLELSPSLTASTGINALAHCIEALYSKTRNPLSTAAAVEGVRHIYHTLFRCFQEGGDKGARVDMLLGSHLAGVSLASVSMGLHHGLCHVLGGTANIPHGIANAIILPHAIRFNAAATAEELIPAAKVMNLSGSSAMGIIEAMADQIFDLIGSMNLPQRLRDTGLAQSDLPHLAQLAFQNRTVQNNPKPITAASQLEQLLEEAW